MTNSNAWREGGREEERRKEGKRGAGSLVVKCVGPVTKRCWFESLGQLGEKSVGALEQVTKP